MMPCDQKLNFTEAQKNDVHLIIDNLCEDLLDRQSSVKRRLYHLLPLSNEQYAFRMSNDSIFLALMNSLRLCKGNISVFGNGSNINVALFNYTRAFGDGPHHFEPWSSDVDDT
ncbi:hypothetical protein TNCV_2499251 [Trichonephila clavipes]|nr:hypothetical protein TNCV_2499251 [Trichonephila clavipes]